MADRPPIEIRPDLWLIVRDILRKHVPGHEVWAFGSRVKGTTKPYSDLDLTSRAMTEYARPPDSLILGRRLS